MSRVSRIDLPLSRLSSTARSRAFFCTSRASAYRWRARAWPDSPRQAGHAARAARTARSTSAASACATRAKTSRVAGLMVSKRSPVWGATHCPPMNSPNSPPWALSHSSAGALLSGAGPYAIVSKMPATVELMSDHRVAVGGRVAAGHEVLELALDVGEQRARADTEQIVAQPAVAQLFLHQNQPIERGLGGANAARGFEPDDVAGAIEILADHPGHHQAHGQGGVDGLLAGGRLDEIGARHHRHETGARYVRQGGELARAEDDLDVGRSAGLTEGADFIVQRLPVPREHVG